MNIHPEKKLPHPSIPPKVIAFISIQDKCVICGNRTGILRSTPIELRSHYVEGAGQVCAQCYDTVFGE